jgi:hypothetical protein
MRDVSLHARFWAGFVGRQPAAEPALEQRDPFRRPERRLMVGARSIRVVVARSAGVARSAAKSGTSARLQISNLTQKW